MVKTILKIRDSLEDDAIEILIPLVEEEILNYCHIKRQTVYPLDLQLAAWKMIGYQLANNNMVQSEKSGEVSVTFLTDYPTDIKRTLNNHRKLIFP